MIGLALVTLVATLAAGIVSSFTSAVNDIFTGDYSITAQNNFYPIPISAAEAAAKAPGVTAVGSVRTGDALVFDKTIFATAVDPGASQVITLDWVEGSQETSPRSGMTAPSSTRATRKTTTSSWARRSTSRSSTATRSVHDQGDLRPADRGDAVRAGHDSAAVWDAKNPSRRTSTRS